MELTLLDQSKDKLNLSFILKGASPSMANALRRTIIDAVPTLAIEDVEISQNSSILYDEMLAHRLGLIPLTTDLETYEIASKCKCKGEGCANCQVKFTLQAKGPGVVYSENVKFVDPKVTPAYGKMVIANLDKGQEIELQGTAILGQGKDHMKFSPGLVYYKYKPVLSIKSQPDDVDKMVEVCPKDIFENNKGKLEINKDKVLTCHLCEACIEANSDVVSLEEKENEHVFYIESFGQLSAGNMVTKAISMITENVDEFSKALK